MVLGGDSLSGYHCEDSQGSEVCKVEVKQMENFLGNLIGNIINIVISFLYYGLLIGGAITITIFGWF
jgi:hypothetical protein